MNTNIYRKIITVNYEDNGYLRFKNISDKPGFLYPWNYAQAPASDISFEYSLDGVNWQSMDLTSVYKHFDEPYGDVRGSAQLKGIKVFPGRNIYLRGVNVNGICAKWWGWGFRMDVPHVISGNMLSIIDYNNMDTITSLPNYCFCLDRSNQPSRGLFGEDTELVSVAGLNFGNVTTLGTYALGALFYNCKNLVDTPDFSGITTIENSAMRGIFENCTSLNDNVDLSGVTSVGYCGLRYAFANCKAMVNPPDIHNIASLSGGNAMDGAFSGCIALTSAPNMANLTSITGNDLWQTFAGCTNMTTGADLRNLSTIGGTTSLTRLYNNCYKLETVYAPNVSTWNTSMTTGWLTNAGRDVPAGTQKTVYCPTGVTIPTDSVDGIPTGWTRVDY